jgi:hypothetical protein
MGFLHEILSQFNSCNNFNQQVDGSLLENDTWEMWPIMWERIPGQENMIW